MNILKINTSNNLLTLVELVCNQKVSILEEKRSKPGDQDVLGLIDRILKENNVALKDVDEIQVNTGPGSFTGLKVGAAIANSLSFAGLVTVNGKNLGEIVVPEY